MQEEWVGYSKNIKPASRGVNFGSFTLIHTHALKWNRTEAYEVFAFISAPIKFHHNSRVDMRALFPSLGHTRVCWLLKWTFSKRPGKWRRNGLIQKVCSCRKKTKKTFVVSTFSKSIFPMKEQMAVHIKTKLIISLLYVLRMYVYLSSSIGAICLSIAFWKKCTSSKKTYNNTFTVTGIQFIR